MVVYGKIKCSLQSLKACVGSVIVYVMLVVKHTLTLCAWIFNCRKGFLLQNMVFKVQNSYFKYKTVVN